jgi:lipopolysaccharide export system permease protein
MRIIDGYLGRAVVAGSMLALLVLISIDLFFAVIEEADDVGVGDYQWLQALGYLGLTLPRRIYELSPAAVLLGSLLSLGALASNSELTAIRAAGVPIAGIARSVLKAGLLLMLATVLVGEFAAPWAEEQAQALRTEARTQGLALQGSEGLWARDGERYIKVGRILPGMRLEDIEVFEVDEDARLREAVRAKTAYFVDDGWVLEQLRRSYFGEAGVSAELVDSERWERLLSPQLFNVIVVEPEQMSAWTLAQYVAYLSANGLDADRYELAFWVRFTTPLSSLVMLLLALPFVFAAQRSGSAGQRLFIGVLIGVVFYLISRGSNHLGLVYGFSPFISATAPLVVFLAAGIFALRRVY